MLLSKVAILYTLEPIFTVIFIVNMNAIWEKVMSSLRAQIFQRVLIQKVGCYSCNCYLYSWLLGMISNSFPQTR